MAAKSVKGGDAVLSCKRGGKSFEVTANAFSVVSFDGVEVLSGVDYYVNKAKEVGATIKTSNPKKKAKVAE
jgi:hypothetical protein